ncbi:MAG: sigma-70 family RNA polymerase sigma factor [Bacteroidota bacterium]
MAQPLAELPDSLLMVRLQKGDTAAFDALYQRYGARLYGYFWRMLSQDKEKARDFTQQLFLKLIENQQRYDSKRSFSTWLFTLAANLVKNEYRRLERLQRNQQKLPRDHPTTELTHQQLDQPYWNEQLQKALQQLSPDHRQCFLLRHQEDRRIPEISAILGIPEGTVKSRLYYATRYLANQLARIKNT